MASAAHAESLDSNWIDPTYQDPKNVETTADLGYLLFFFAISVVGIARDVFSKSDSKSLKDATRLKGCSFGTVDWQLVVPVSFWREPVCMISVSWLWRIVFEFPHVTEVYGCLGTTLNQR